MPLYTTTNTTVRVDWEQMWAEQRAELARQAELRREREERRRQELARRNIEKMSAPLPVTEDVAPRLVHRVSCKCETCKSLRAEPTKLKAARVHPYTHRPRGGWRPKMMRGETTQFFLGVELETDMFTPDGTYSELTNEVAADMRLPKNFWVAKRDGSVTGPEFASQPASFAYWKAHKAQLSQMFKMLVHAGYRSHDNDRCGMHINISRTAFDDQMHFYRFLTLLHHSPDWTLKMSQRTVHSANQWASLTQAATDYARQRIASSVFRGRGTGTGRYSAINVPDENRVEFRLPRGTLRIDRFFKNLEWVVAMVEFTRSHEDVMDITVGKFLTYARANKREYPNLVRFIRETSGRGRPSTALFRPIEVTDASTAEAREELFITYERQYRSWFSRGYYYNEAGNVVYQVPPMPEGYRGRYQQSTSSF